MPHSGVLAYLSGKHGLSFASGAHTDSEWDRKPPKRAGRWQNCAQSLYFKRESSENFSEESTVRKQIQREF